VPRSWRTRADPFAATWQTEVVPLRASDEGAALDGPTILAELCRRHGEILAPHVDACPGDIVALAPNVLSIRHWDRLMGGALYAATPRVDWAPLLRRAFDVDVLRCPRCQGRGGVTARHVRLRPRGGRTSR
jgi:hypothetical protein